MKLIVKNLGSIKEAAIDLDKRFYLFVGYNNTCKTYMSKLIFTIFHIETTQSFPNKQSLQYQNIDIIDKKITLSNELVENLLHVFADHLRGKFLDSLKISKENSLFDDFSVAFQFTEEEVLNATFDFSSNIGFQKKSYELFTLKKDKDTRFVSYKEINIVDSFTGLNESEKNEISNIVGQRGSFENIQKSLFSTLLRSLLQINTVALFFPADRVFYLKHKRSIFSAEYDRKKKAENYLQELLNNERKSEQDAKIDLQTLFKLLKPSHTNAEDILIEEIITKIENPFLNETLTPTENYSSLVNSMERIMGGKVLPKRIDLPTGEKEIEYVFEFTNNIKQKNELSLAVSSSSVNQLSTIALLLEYSFKKNNFIFIDEPEENLHPQNQILLLNLLLEFTNTHNNRVLIASHSSLLAEALNNYLILCSLKNKEEIAKEFNMPSADLNPENIGIYYFNGEAVFEHKIGAYGTIFTSFKLTQEAIYQTNEVLSELMFKQLNKKKKFENV